MTETAAVGAGSTGEADEGRREVEAAALAALGRRDEIDLSDFAEPIRAEVVAAMLQGDHGTLPRTGVTLVGVEIEGSVLLRNAVIPVQLTLHRCRVPDGLDLGQAQLRSLLLSETTLGRPAPDPQPAAEGPDAVDDAVASVAVWAPSLSVELDLVLDSCTVHGFVWLGSADVGGDVLLRGTTIDPGGDGFGLVVDQASVHGSVGIHGGGQPGGVSADRADIGGNLTLAGLDDAGPVSLDGVHVAHDMLVAGLERCRQLLVGDGRVDGVMLIRDSTVGVDDDDGSGATPAVRLTRARVGGGMRLWQSNVLQALDAESARFGGKVTIARTAIAGTTEIAGCDLTSAVVQGSLEVGPDSSLAGGLSIMSADISQSVNVVASRIGSIAPPDDVTSSLASYAESMRGQSVYGTLARVGGFFANGTVLEGSLNLAGVSCASTIRLDSVQLGASRLLVDAANAEVAFHGVGVTCGVDLVLHRVEAAGAVLLAGAEVKGTLASVEVVIEQSPGAASPALALVGAHIGGNLVVSDLTTNGLLGFGRLSVGGDATIAQVRPGAADPEGAPAASDDAPRASDGATQPDDGSTPAALLDVPRFPTGLDGVGAVFHGNVVLAGLVVDLMILGSARIDGVLRLWQCDLAQGARMPALSVGSDLQIIGCSLAATPQSILGVQHAVALQVTGATLGQDVVLQDVTAKGSVWLANSDIGGVVVVDASSLGDADAPGGGGSLTLTSSLVRATVWLKDSTFNGRISLDGARLNGNMQVTGVTVTGGPDGIALTASSLVVGAAFIVEGGSKLHGGIAAPGLAAGQIFVLSDATIDKPPGEGVEAKTDATDPVSDGVPEPVRDGDDGGQGAPEAGPMGWSVSLRGARLEGGLLVDRATLDQGLLLDGVAVHRDFVVQRTTIGSSGGARWAVIVDDAELRAGVELSGSTLLGGLSFDGTAVAGDLAVDDITIDVPSEALALAARSTTIRGGFRLGTVTTTGAADLTRATVAFLRDAPERWQTFDRVVLTGLVVERVDTDDPRWPLRARITWLEGASTHGSAPFEVYAERYDEAQKPSAADELRIAAAARGYRSRVIRALLRPIGYGYRPLNAVVPVVALFVLVFGVMWWAQANDRFVPTDPPAATTVTSSHCDERVYPCLRPTGYALDVLVPVVDFDEQRDWRPATRPLRIVLWLATVAGWLFTTMLVLGITSRLRQE